MSRCTDECRQPFAPTNMWSVHAAETTETIPLAVFHSEQDAWAFREQCLKNFGGDYAVVPCVVAGLAHNCIHGRNTHLRPRAGELEASS